MEAPHKKSRGQLRDFELPREGPSSASLTNSGLPRQETRSRAQFATAHPLRSSSNTTAKVSTLKDSSVHESSAPAAPARASQQPKASAQVQEWVQDSEPFEGADLWYTKRERSGTEVNLSEALASSVVEKREAQAPQRVVASVVDEAENFSSTSSATHSNGAARSGVAQSEHAGPLPWAVELALEERRMEKEGVVDVSNAFRKQELLKTRTREFMRDLHREFRRQVELFNEARRDGAAALRVFRVSNTEDDFMLFRNSVKLIVSGQRAGRVSFAFNQFLGHVFNPQSQSLAEIEASWGVFDQLCWYFKGERVETSDVVRYFVTEFVRQSCR